VIGWGAPNKQGTASMHGEAMGNDEIDRHAPELGVDHRRRSIYRPTSGRHGTCSTRVHAWKPGSGWRAICRVQNRIPRSGRPSWSGACRAIMPNGFCRTRECLHRTHAGRGQVARPRASPRRRALKAPGPRHCLELLGGSADLTPLERQPWRKDSVDADPRFARRATTCISACASSACRRC